MALAKFTNTSLGGLIFYDRRGAEIYLERRESKTADVDTNHPPIKAWLEEGMILQSPADTGEITVAAQEEAARLEAQRSANEERIAADPQADLVTIIAGEPRPIS